MTGSRGREIAAWVIAITLCLVFLAAGLLKLAGVPAMKDAFVLFGLPLWFMYVTGALQAIAAILVVVPRYSWIGAVLIMCDTVGAFVALLTHDQAGRIGLPLLFLVLAAAVFYLRGGLTNHSQAHAADS